MPALNFQRRFVEAIEFGHKTQTIRAHRKDGRPHAKVGDELKLYTGMRTSQCTLIARATVTRIDAIFVDVTAMKLNGAWLPTSLVSRDGPQTDSEFAQDDGFEDFCDMRDFLIDAHGKLPFEGVVIHWRDLRE